MAFISSSSPNEIITYRDLAECIVLRQLCESRLYVVQVYSSGLVQLRKEIDNWLEYREHSVGFDWRRSLVRPNDHGQREFKYECNYY
jgi:hypothetical protein